MARYRGYFNSLSCKNYEVRITPSGDTSAYQEIMLAGDEPFVVRYNTSETPFSPVRTSTATINIVRDDYLEDALSNCAQGTKVELLDITTPNSPVTLWVGYLTPKVFNAGYDSCYESFSLEAADCISSLQYIDYEEINGGGITSILDILAQICDACVELEGFYWTRGKKLTGGVVLYPNTLKISEHNFQTNDTEEYWKLSEVLKEISQYIGFTCLQYGKRMYFIDYQYLENNGDIYCNFFSKSNNYGRGSATHLDSAYTVTAKSYLSNGASISMEPMQMSSYQAHSMTSTLQTGVVPMTSMPTSRFFQLSHTSLPTLMAEHGIPLVLNRGTRKRIVRIHSTGISRGSMTTNTGTVCTQMM